MIFYFSATGNSRVLAETLAANLGDRTSDISALMSVNNYEYHFHGKESLGFVFPIYGWSLPKIVRSFLQKLQLHDYNNRYTYFAVTCGDDVGVADRPIREALAEAGLQLNAGYSVVMPDCYVCLPGFDVDSDDERRGKFKRFRSRVDEISDQIAEHRNIMDIKRGTCAWLKTNVLGAVFRRFLVTDKPFRSTSDCIGCGKCVETCPLRNISLNNQHRPQWHGNCTGCLACYHHCPTRAIRFGRRTEKKGQYLLEKHKSELFSN